MIRNYARLPAVSLIAPLLLLACQGVDYEEAPIAEEEAAEVGEALVNGSDGRVFMGSFADRDWSHSNYCGDKITANSEWDDSEQWYGNPSQKNPYFRKIFPEMYRSDGSTRPYTDWKPEIDRIKVQGGVPYVNLEFHGKLLDATDSNSGNVPYCWHGASPDEDGDGVAESRVGVNVINKLWVNDLALLNAVKDVAAGLRDSKVPVMVDLFHEANGNWYDWSPCKWSGESWYGWREGFKKVVNIFRGVDVDGAGSFTALSTPASNVKFTHSVWPTNFGCAGTSAGNPTINDIYIDGYMDGIGVDPYGDGTDQFTTLMNATGVLGSGTLYNELASKGKPLYIGEMAVAKGFTNRQGWMTTFRDSLVNNYPAIRGFNWFDINKAWIGGAEKDWTINANSGDGAHFDGLMNHSDFVGSFGVYEVRSVSASGKCLDVSAGSSADGANVQVYTCNGTAAQTFTFVDLGAFKMELRAAHSDKCVDVAGGSSANGANIQQWNCSGSSTNQTFTMDVLDWATMKIKLKTGTAANKCADVDGGAGPNVHQWDCYSNNANQEFTLVKR
jgi:hypothetical protein